MSRIQHINRLFLILIAVAATSAAAWSQTYDSQNSTVTGKHSTLPTSDGKSIRDDTFAGMLMPLLIHNGNSNAKDAKFLMAQCFGGGMFDELSSGIGNKLPWVGASGARYDESSWGTGGANAGIDHWSDTLFKSYDGTKTVYQNGERARLNDPVGVAKVGGTPQKLADGTPVIEHPQTTYGNGGENITMRDLSATSHHAILWAGSPNGYRHYADVSDAYNRLKTEWAGQNYTINVLFGDGAKNSKGENLPAEWNAKAATQENLQQVIDGLQNLMNPNEQFLFFSSDHGGTETVIVDTPVVVDWTHWIATDVTIYEGEFAGMLQTPDNTPYLDIMGTAQAPGTLFYGYYDRSHSIHYWGVTIGTAGDFAQHLLLPDYESVMLGGMFVPGDLKDAGFFAQFFGNNGTGATINSFVFGTGAINNSINPVPEPATTLALLTPLAALVRQRRRRS